MSMFKRFIIPLRLIAALAFLLLLPRTSNAQKARADSLSRLLTDEQTDTGRITLLWQLASATSSYKPDTALTIGFEALSLARKENYLEGESRATGILANVFMRIGNYPKALELNIEKLKLEEKRNRPENMASVLMNIGVVYALQEEYNKALEYYAQADSIIQEKNVDVLKYNIALNTGDTYDRLGKADSAFKFFSRSLQIAREEQDGDLIGTSMTGLGHTYRKLKNYPASLNNYKEGMRYLTEAHDDEVLCEAALGLAKLFEERKQTDSAKYYASVSLKVAKNGGFLTKELEAAEFLTDHYKTERNIDSAFTYVSYVQGLNDEVNSKDKIRESQVISSNEQFRQLQMEEDRIAEKKKRFQQLQMLLIAIFIPGFFLVTLILSRVNVPVRFVRLLGILSLLFLFEYLTLLLHPTVAQITHHTPVLEILIFVALAAILIPAHHKLEHWMIHKLLYQRFKHTHPAKPATEQVAQK